MNCLSYFHFSVHPKVVSGLKSETQLRKVDDILLKCEMYGIPAPSISWKKDGSILNESTFNITEHVSESKGTTISLLFLKQVDHTRIGNYTCIGVNAFGNISSATILDFKG